MIKRLPSLKSNNLQESIITKLTRFQHGFEMEKPYIDQNTKYLLNTTGKEFFLFPRGLCMVWKSRRGNCICKKHYPSLLLIKTFEELHPEVIKT